MLASMVKTNNSEGVHNKAVEQALAYPQLRFMGNKFRLLSWIAEELSGLYFTTALDAFSGSGCVSYLFKCMGKQVTSNDFLLFAYNLAKAAVENSSATIDEKTFQRLLAKSNKPGDFIQKTFQGVFFDAPGLQFLDSIWSNIEKLSSPNQKSIAIAALVRSCMKKQPRGVFTVADPEKYKDGRRDLRLTLSEHFRESVSLFNSLVFSNGYRSKAHFGDIFALNGSYDLVYMDPPYVPRADDNCYIKRYHFLEGLASYWKAPGTGICQDTKVKKIPKRYTPFSYRKSAIHGFTELFDRFRTSQLVLSYSSNGYPDLDVLRKLMRQFKHKVTVRQKEHRYHFGTHDRVSSDRASVREYLIIGE